MIEFEFEDNLLASDFFLSVSRHLRKEGAITYPQRQATFFIYSPLFVERVEDFSPLPKEDERLKLMKVKWKYPRRYEAER